MMNNKRRKEEGNLLITDPNLFAFKIYLIDIKALQIILSRMDSFGKQRLKDFYADPKYVNVNHGSYGYTPKVVMQHLRSLQEQCEFNTEKWFRIDAEQQLNQMRAYVGKKINCPIKNVYFVQNATDGINCLAKSLRWQQGDIVLLPNTAYASIRKTFYWLRDLFNIIILDLNFTVQDMASQQTYQMKIEDFVNSYPKKIKLAVFDHIISVPGFVTPIDAIVEFFKEKRITLFVDGAHAINQVNVDMAELEPDAYFSNFHKWAYTPKTSAFLYLSDKFVDSIKPSITGNFYGEGPAREYFWTGTRDLCSHLCVKKGLQYSESFGQNAVRNYNHSLAVTGAKKVAEIWGTKMLTTDERCIEVPSNDQTLCNDIALQMMDSDNCYPIIFKFDGRLFTRLSAQLYNQISDYEFMARTFLVYLKKERPLTRKERTKPSM